MKLSWFGVLFLSILFLAKPAYGENALEELKKESDPMICQLAREIGITNYRDSRNDYSKLHTADSVGSEWVRICKYLLQDLLMIELCNKFFDSMRTSVSKQRATGISIRVAREVEIVIKMLQNDILATRVKEVYGLDQNRIDNLLEALGVLHHRLFHVLGDWDHPYRPTIDRSKHKIKSASFSGDPCGGIVK